MRRKIDIDMDEVQRLKDKEGWSFQQIANKFTVTRKTIKNRYREAKGGAIASDPQVLSFARKIEMLVSDAPNEYCRKEITRAVNFLRTRHAISPEEKKKLIIQAIKSEAREVEEIASDCNLSIEETQALLDTMVQDLELVSRPRGGVMNRGRKTKLQYFLIPTISV